MKLCTMPLTLAVALLTMSSSCTSAPEIPAAQPAAPDLDITSVSGGSVATPLTHDLKVNARSSLNRTAYVINDPGGLAKLDDAFIRTVFISEYPGEYRYTEVGSVEFKEAVTAFEVVYLLFDVWGSHLKSLQDEEITDIPANTPVELTDYWRASENDVSSYLTCFSYVRRVRLADGTIWTVNLDRVYESVKEIVPDLQKESLVSEQSEPPEAEAKE